MSEEITTKINDESDYFLYYAHEGLLKFGGSFANALGNMLGKSDRSNTLKILMMWTKELTDHARLFVTWALHNRPDLLRPGYEIYLTSSPPIYGGTEH